MFHSLMIERVPENDWQESGVASDLGCSGVH